jgi:hypothetical protein
MKTALDAFGEADCSWVKSLESIWSDADATIRGPNDTLEDDLVATLLQQTKDASRKPPGRVLVGQAGIGKTHLVGNLRRKVWVAGGWFVLLDVIGITDFWKSAALSFLTSLMQQMPDGRRQSEAVFAGVARRLNVENQVETAFKMPDVEAKRIVDLLVPGLAMIDFMKAQQHQDVFRALALLRSQDFAAVGVAHGWLQGYEADEEKRIALGLAKPPPSPIELVRGMSWLMSTAGPTLVAVDQVDGVINAGRVTIHTDNFSEQKSFGDLLSAGLLQLYDVLARSQTVITCLFDSWKELEQGLQPAIDRFQPPPTALEGMSEAAAIGALIESRLAPALAGAGYQPPFSTWPFTAAAIESARGMMPRQILMACDNHRRYCLANVLIGLCDSFEVSAPPTSSIPNGFEQEFLSLRATATFGELLDNKDDGEIGRLLRDVFDLYAKQIEPRDNIDVVSKGDPAQKMPPLHGRLTFVLHDEKDREMHFCFRAIKHANAISFQSRMRAALTASGIDSGIPDRHLIVARRGPIPSGKKSKELHDAFLAAGGMLIDPTDEELKCFVALRDMRNAAVIGGALARFEAWLRKASPLCATAFFKAARLCPPPGFLPTPEPAGTRPSRADEAVAPSVAPGTTSSLPTAPLGRSLSIEPLTKPVQASSAEPRPSPTIIPIGYRMGVDGAQVDLATNLLPRAPHRDHRWGWLGQDSVAASYRRRSSAGPAPGNRDRPEQ